YFGYKAMIDAVFSGITLSKTTGMVLVIATYLFTQQVSSYLYGVLSQYYFDYIVRSKFQSVLARTFMHTMAQLDFANLENGETRNLMARVMDTYSWRLPEIVTRINYILYNIVSLVLSFIIALQFNLTYFFILALIAVPFYFVRARYGNAAYSIYSVNGTKTNLLWDLRNTFSWFSTLAEIKLYGLENHFIQKAKDLQLEILKDYKKPILTYSFIATLEYILTPIAMLIAINFFIGNLIASHQSIGSFTLFVSILFGFGGDLANILSNLNSIYENNLYANDYFKLTSMKNTISSQKNAFVFKTVEPREIVFDHVSFSYPDAKEKAVNNVTFTIQKGQDVAIVGHNGAGKTTLIKLLLRFYDPTEGRILVDGHDLKDINLESWYQQLGTLFQDFARYNLSLKENIQVGNISEKEHSLLEKALSQANATDILSGLTKGWDQRLGRWLEDSQELSVGQWQKVAIARALYRNAPLLIMDEPTANIDAEAEAEIFENLKKVYQKKSLIFISHRFSTVRMADRIIVIDKGKIEEQGNHAELLKKKGLYSHYFLLQKKGYE
ncbi:MAG TPA: ABC transporter ATP-binding protein, partial [Patescibacteria group bacterium]|nr:ABC transporter ATP-binding protein [Patescibacteria group bacterium]